MSSSPSKPGRQQRGRGYRRRQSHAAASSEPFRPREVAAHPLVPAGEPELIATDAALTDLLSHVRQLGRCCYDSEFIGESFYHPHLCLVQVATTRRVAVIDALAPIDLGPVWAMLADAAVEKIVHAGMQDLEPVVRHLGCGPVNVFDTQIVAGMVGLPYPLSLRRLTSTLLTVRLGKGLTFTSWDQRPLSPAHLHYAADDVRYGLALHGELESRLTALGRAAWARRQCESLCDPDRYRGDHAAVAQKVRGSRDLGGPQAAALYELVVLRDELARLHDLPPRSAMRDELLLDMARRQPRTAEELETIRGLPRPIKADFGPRLLEAVARGVQARQPPWQREPEYEESPEEQFRSDALWAAVQAYCRSLSIDPALLCTRGELADALRAVSAGRPLSAKLAGGWRGEFFDALLPGFLAGTVPIKLRWQGDRLTHE